MAKFTVTQLMQALNKLPPNQEVWMASDGECNNISPVFEVDVVIPEDVLELKEYEPEQYEDMPAEGVVLLIPT